MTSKEVAIKTIQDLPDSVTWADIEERIRFLAAIDRGLADIKSGKIIPHQEVKESLKKWPHRTKAVRIRRMKSLGIPCCQSAHTVL